MRVEFRQGVPKGCIAWLWENVGEGNIYPSKWPSNEINTGKMFAPCDSNAWKYERITVVHESKDPRFDSNESYVPTITVYDEKKAVLFALRWS